MHLVSNVVCPERAETRSHKRSLWRKQSQWTVSNCSTLSCCYSPHPSTQAWLRSKCMLSQSRRGGRRRGDEQPGLSWFKGLGPVSTCSRMQSCLVSAAGCCSVFVCSTLLPLRLLNCSARPLPPLPYHSVGKEAGGWGRLEMTGSQHHLPCAGLVNCLVSLRLKAHALSIALISTTDALLLICFCFTVFVFLGDLAMFQSSGKNKDRCRSFISTNETESVDQKYSEWVCKNQKRDHRVTPTSSSQKCVVQRSAARPHDHITPIDPLKPRSLHWEQDVRAVETEQ